mmetsp:Transcript_25751/g.43385  ORF Transcript_25751/g.43385 Transcript_25751/m.43385 type:complete len:888 (+) Transcript_25751:164-2827(+)|eukprot:CAMPEP_0114418896 /NCGR_PEP_ID=MMETSP0103-20121206/3740_1 /TAXON_ID=37642 ORGANISM="Paraphysomonas imperforata, Strain PA2" /NCGR_SAMPLE_ID=MMETSP0103 /ASSEMBLY_ACC=CAM_ASM_000201 /LENGTH=887 /DNA_ID=CAMNT_0001587283 /DNA_START=150 /DNA_END=2813 /DNA_ORIENTATION=+
MYALGSNILRAVGISKHTLTCVGGKSSRGFRSSSVGMGRKGASAFIEKPRPFSKKQKKRFKKKMLLRAEHEKRGMANGKLSTDVISQQLESPEAQALVDNTGESILKDVREMMLPDGLQALLQEFDNKSDFDMNDLGLAVGEEHRTPHFSEIGMKIVDEEAGQSSTSGLSLGLDLVTEEQANDAVVLAASQGKKGFVYFMFHQMTRVGIPVMNDSLACVLESFSKLGLHDEVEECFDKALECGVTPDSQSWSAYIAATAHGKGHSSALLVLERVRRIGVHVSASAYTAVLQDLVDDNENDEAFEFWMRMKEDGVVVDVTAYEVMMQQCVQTHQVERAFNYLDEMRGSKIDPSVAIFEKLFRCCGSAPHWVNGYQDIIFDAMALMEGAELLPSPLIYDNIIHSFGRAGDAASAEFYFWEMREKGIEQSASTYRNLFDALASSQRVGASKYAVRPRYVRPPEKPKTELQLLMLKAGAVATANMLSSRFSSEGKLERGKRQYAPLVSSEDEMNPDDAEEELLEELRLETMGQPDFHEMLVKRQQRQRTLRDNETGRTIELSLLSRGQGVAPGKIYHTAPSDTTTFEHFSIHDLASRNIDMADMADSYKVIPPTHMSDSLDYDSIRNIVSNKQGVSDVQCSTSNTVVDLLDDVGDDSSPPHFSSSSLTCLLSDDVIPTQEIDRQWQAVLFGRSPDPDFSAAIKERRRDNIIRADALYAEMLDQGVEPDASILSAYMSVASEAMQWEKTHEILESFNSKHDISPDILTFKYLIRMHIFMSDIEGCLKRFDEMKSRGLTPDRETYGMLVATLSHRDDLLKAVNILEEAHSNGIKISNRHIKKLRARFNKLNIQHPNIFPDPNLWVKDFKKVRENKRNARKGNKLQYLNSLSFI